MRRWPVPVLVLLAAGSAARLVSLGLSWGKPLDPDASEYLLLARRYSFAHPWSASYREPLWRAIVKAATAPFGYSPDALRSLTTLVSIATLPIAWILLRRLADRRELGQRVPLIGLALMALSLQLVREAPRGLREDTVLLVFLFVGYPLLAGERGRRAGIAIGVAVGLLSVIRWEVGVLAVIVCAGFALLRRGPVLAPIVGIVLLVALSGPWLAANKARHGDLLYNTKVHATYYWKYLQPVSVQEKYASPPGVDPPVHVTWQQFYLDELGLPRTLEQGVEGYPRILGKLVAAEGVPRSAAASVLGQTQLGARWLLVTGLVTLLALAAAIAVARRLRTLPGRETALTALLLLVVMIAPYAPIAAYAELRVLLFGVPVFLLVAAIAIDACLPERVRFRRATWVPASRSSLG